jgi:hypothetical protein
MALGYDTALDIHDVFGTKPSSAPSRGLPSGLGFKIDFKVVVAEY